MKEKLLNAINNLHEEMKDLTKAGSCGEYSGQAEYEDTKGIIDSVLKSEIVKQLLFLFWQRASDACPLEYSDFELELTKWEEWISSIDFDTLVEASKRHESVYCMPDGINSKEEHDEYLEAIGLKPKN